MTNKGPTVFFLYWFPVVIYCAAIFVQSSFPAPIKVPRFVLADKLLHFFAYAVLGMLFLRGFLHSSYRGKRRFILFASILLTVLYGFSDELHQYFVPSRSAELLDLLFDSLGACVGVWAYDTLLHRYPVLSRI